MTTACTKKCESAARTVTWTINNRERFAAPMWAVISQDKQSCAMKRFLKQRMGQALYFAGKGLSRGRQARPGPPSPAYVGTWRRGH
jgi:hypothetical protein